MGTVFAAALAFLSSGAFAAPAWSVTKGVAYLEGSGSPLADVYRPAGSDSSHRMPGFLWIHGGGWSGGTRDGAREVAVCSTLARAGYVTFSIDYVLSDSAKPSWPANLQQCKAAIRFMRRYAARYGVDTARIAVGGGSAGAHLAVMAGLTKPGSFANTSHKGYSDRVKAILDLYGPVSTRGWYGTPVKWLLGVTSVSDPLVAQSSAETYVAKDSPPVFIAHGLVDATVDPQISKAFDSALTAVGASHELVLIPGAGHSFTLEQYNGKPLAVDLKTQVLDWLGKRLGHATALGVPRAATAGAGFLGNAVDVPAAWADAPTREVTFELRDREGRRAASGSLRAEDLFSGWGPVRPRVRPGAYALILRMGGSAALARIVVLR
jgi:acetyl esterase/lipase